MGVALVTGASGFIGRQAVAALTGQGFAVHAVARRPIDGLLASWHAVDLLDPAARRGLIAATRPSHLLHLAWETRHGVFWEAPDNRDWVDATVDLVGAFRDGGGERAVFAGTCAEYDWSPAALGDGVCHEDTTPQRPVTAYGAAKHAAHERIRAFAARTGLSHAWGRLFLLYGPFEAEHRLVPSVVRALLEGRPVEINDPGAVRDFFDVRDAGAAFACLLASPVEGAVNIASGHGVSVAELGRRLARLVRGDDRVPDDIRAPAEGGPARLLADVARLRDEVGFAPSRDLDAGLADAVAWWRSQ